MASEPEDRCVDDEELDRRRGRRRTRRRPATSAACARSRSPLGGDARRRRRRHLVHRVLEATDFASATSRPSSPRASAEQRGRRDVDIGDADAVVAGLAAAIETPLGPLLDELRLRDVARADRLDELDFELPLVGGDTPTGTLALDATSPRCSRAPRRRRPARRLRRPAARPARSAGTCAATSPAPSTSSLRARAGDGAPASPSSTTRPTGSAPTARTLSAWHYRPAALAEAMQRAHYPLQALLYLVALHRYLRGRLPDYDPSGTSPASSTCSCAG